MITKELFVFCDGGSRGNPGPAAIGFVVEDSSGKILVKKSKHIGKTTNNVAEYTAVIEALKWIKENYPITQLPNYPITFFLDSQLVVNQLNGLFKIKSSNLRSLVIRVRRLEREVGGSLVYRYIPREKNRQADLLVNQVFKKI